jgi:nucleoside-diphosphate-sugar epimerase
MFSEKIMITGAGGLIGSSVIKDLADNGFDVLGIYKQNKAAYEWEHLVHDFISGQLSSDRFKKIGCIIHCASSVPRDSSRAESELAAAGNKIIDDKIIQLANDLQCKLIYTSGTSVYGFDGDICFKESDKAADKLAPYIRQKYLSECNILKKVEDSIILRISAPYAYYQKANTVLKTFINKAIHHENIVYYGTGERCQDFIHAKDVAYAIRCCLSKENIDGIYNISSGKSISMKSLAKLIISFVPDCRSEILPSDVEDAQENYKALFDISKAKAKLGWQPTISLSEGINEWIKYLTQ